MTPPSDSTLALKIEHYLAHGLFFMLIFGLAYWIWPLENKGTTEFTTYMAVLLLGTVLFNSWKKNWMNRVYDQSEQ
ncbi:hypothetical protein [Polynucleobacter kasalickyi]|uniref:Uncharacterized protein n=1 Tax=Polynucleobacter kasalickyi TaxID=1938817 RepID=A0A1W1Y5W8_9BURK|nr:hypothetical protein [Polynucleobacter kasalickyi]SMC31572.1 hypothetical protein SAMN06296008_1028 [Polynucleobacter kasalickyi]